MGPFSRDLGLCSECSSKGKAGTKCVKRAVALLGSGNTTCGKRKREAGRLGGRLGGSAEGDAKRRCGEANGKCSRPTIFEGIGMVFQAC